MAVIFCFPCVIWAMRWLRVGNFASTEEGGHGLDEEILNQIPIYYFRKAPVEETADSALGAQDTKVENTQSTEPMENINGQNHRNVLTLSSEEGKCIICLGDYEVDEELKVLPCNHHFHRSCIDEWLHIQKTCPLCVQEVQYQNNPDDSAQSC